MTLRLKVPGTPFGLYMTFQYALRFESGKRRGETVPISTVAARGGAFTIGRNPGNSLQVTDASVSGRHAELEVTKDGVELRDLDSTNGTTLGGRKVRAVTLLHGDEFVLGAVEFTLFDTAQDGGTEAAADDAVDGAGGIELEDDLAIGQAAGLSQTQITPRDDSLEITAEDLARSKRSSKLGPIVLVGLAAVGGAAWWWFGQRDSGGGSGGQAGRNRAAAVAVTPPAGNLISAGYSFEAAAGWASGGDENDAQFDVVSGAARSGRRGVRAELAPGEVALLESDAVRISGASRTMRAVAFGARDGDIEMRMGLRFSNDDGSVRSTVWSDALPAGSGEAAAEFRELGVTATAPTGLNRAQVVLRAASTVAAEAVASEDSESDAEVATSEVDVDDVALVPQSSAAHAPTSNGPWTVSPMGGEGAPSALALTQLDRVLVSSLRVVSASSAYAASDLSITASDTGMALAVGSGGELVLRAEELAVAGGVATMGTGGYASHGTSFERTGATDLLIGDGPTLVRVHFARPTDVTGRPQGAAVVVRAAVQGGDTLDLQLEFKDGRTQAERLARRADEERRAGDSGAALRTWNELLSEVPFDTRLIDRAATAQGEMLSAGRDELKALTAEVERARFFGLADLYREKLAKAHDLGARYRGSDVEASCAALAQTIEDELRTLDAGSTRDEAKRLEAIGAVLKNEGAPTLAREIETYMNDMVNGASAGDGNR